MLHLTNCVKALAVALGNSGMISFSGGLCTILDASNETLLSSPSPNVAVAAVSAVAVIVAEDGLFSIESVTTTASDPVSVVSREPACTV